MVAVKDGNGNSNPLVRGIYKIYNIPELMPKRASPLCPPTDDLFSDLLALYSLMLALCSVIIPLLQRVSNPRFQSLLVNGFN